MWQVGDVVVCRYPADGDWFSDGYVGVVVDLDPPREGAYVRFFVRLGIADLEHHQEYHTLKKDMHPETHWMYYHQMDQIEISNEERTR